MVRRNRYQLGIVLQIRRGYGSVDLTFMRNRRVENSKKRLSLGSIGVGGLVARLIPHLRLIHSVVILLHIVRGIISGLLQIVGIKPDLLRYRIGASHMLGTH